MGKSWKKAGVVSGMQRVICRTKEVDTRDLARGK